MRAALLVVAVISASACASTHEASPDGGAGATGTGGASGAGGLVPPMPLPLIPEDGYSMAPDDTGGYLLGPNEIKAADLQHTPPAASSTGCQRLRGIVRDFRGALPAVGGPLMPGGHPDFEVFEGKGVTPGLVGLDLGSDNKPRYTGICELGMPMSATCPYGAMTTTAANFAQWYTSVEGVNKTYFLYFKLVDNQMGQSTFSSIHFFPLDNTGWGNSGLDADMKTMRNFSFTTEIHTTFRYNGHEIFTFLGDDDVWIFVNGKLAVDLGGLHEQVMGSVDLDAQAAALGIVKGTQYALDLFHAERHSQASDFRIDMNFSFLDCGYIIP